MQDAESTTTNQHKQYQCRHIFTDGRRCSSPCLRHEEFCYYHHTTRKPVANPKQRRNRRSTFHLPLPEDRSAIQSSIGQVLQGIASNDIDPRRAGLLLYGLQIASLNLPKIQTLAKPAAEPQTVEEITIDPTLGILAPRTEVSEIAKRKSPVAQLIERMMQSEETAPTPEPATIPTLQATADNLHSTHTVKPRQLSFRPERSAEPLFSTGAKRRTLVFDRSEAPNPCHFDRSEAQWRNPLLYLSSHPTAFRLCRCVSSSTQFRECHFDRSAAPNLCHFDRSEA